MKIIVELNIPDSQIKNACKELNCQQDFLEQKIINEITDYGIENVSDAIDVLDSMVELFDEVIIYQKTVDN